MAGMFYSLKEAAKQLGKTEDQVKQLVKENKLREFRDGSNLLFKIEEVNALLAEGVEAGADELKLEELPAAEPAEALGGTALAGLGEAVEDDLFKLDEDQTPAAGTAPEGGEAPDLDLIPDLEEPQAAQTEAKEEAPEIELGGPQAAEEAPDLELEGPQAAEAEPTQAEETGGLDLEEPQVTDKAAAEDDLLLSEELAEPAGEKTEQPLADEAEGSSEEISLAQESGLLAEGSDITDMDTAVTGEGVNVLGATDTDYNVTEDSMAETAGPAASAGSSAEPSLEEIEDDVNLDSFGSGSGLLDLSLQADDTSLGGILDEIYTDEGGKGEATPAEGEEAPAEALAEGGEGPAFDDITAEADHAPGEEEMAVPEPVAVMPATMAPAFAEVAPDAQSNLLGILLFVPLLASIYTAIVAISGHRHFMPSILAPIQGLIWPIVIGVSLLTLVVFGISFTVGREKAPRAPKAAKVEKGKKEKAVKAEKPAKEAAAKPAKEKKGFFSLGKKKEKGAK